MIAISKTSKTRRRPALWCGIAWIGFILGTASIATAGPTHQGQSAKEHVVLNFFDAGPSGLCPAGGEGGALSFYRVLPDGKTTKFSIPEDRLLVVTDFNMTGYLSSTIAPDTSIETALHLDDAASKTKGTLVFRESLHLTSGLVSQRFSTEGQSLSGIVVGPEAKLCPGLSVDDGANSNLSLLITSGNYRGYLVEATP